MEAIWIEGGVEELIDESFEWVDDMMHEMIKVDMSDQFEYFLWEYYGLMIDFGISDTLQYIELEELKPIMREDLETILKSSIEEFGEGEKPEGIEGSECELEYLVYYQLKHECSAYM